MTPATEALLKVAKDYIEHRVLHEEGDFKDANGEVLRCTDCPYFDENIRAAVRECEATAPATFTQSEATRKLPREASTGESQRRTSHDH